MIRLSSFTDGIVKNNAIFKQVLGLCPTLAVTTAAINGVGMGLATTAVLLGANIVVSLVARFIPKSVRIPSYILIIATFVTIVDLLMNAYFHSLHKSLGLFIPLIVVNCIVLGRSEIFASKNNIPNSILDALGTGLGFTLGLTLLASVRELFGVGTVFGYTVMPDGYVSFILMILPVGGFITLGLLMALFNYVGIIRERRRL